METSNSPGPSAFLQSLSKLLYEHRQRPDDTILKSESNADKDDEVHTVKITPLSIRNLSKLADRSLDDGNNAVAVEPSDRSQAESEENVDISDRANVLSLINVEIISLSIN